MPKLGAAEASESVSVLSWTKDRRCVEALEATGGKLDVAPDVVGGKSPDRRGV